MTKLIEILAAAMIVGSCFNAFAIYFGLRAIAGAIIQKRLELRFKIPSVILEASRDGSEFKIKQEHIIGED